MISGIKILIFSLLSAIGIRHFNQELYTDIMENPTQYLLSIGTGLLTYSNIPINIETNMIAGEFIKMVFAVITTALVVSVSFIIKKILDPLWEQKLKPWLYNLFKLSK